MKNFIAISLLSVIATSCGIEATSIVKRTSKIDVSGVWIDNNARTTDYVCVSRHDRYKSEDKKNSTPGKL